MTNRAERRRAQKRQHTDRTNAVLTFLQRSAMTDRKLSSDVTRCNGRITTSPTGFGTISVGQAECLRCLRRTAERSEYVWMMEPPARVAGRCLMRLGE